MLWELEPLSHLPQGGTCPTAGDISCSGLKVDGGMKVLNTELWWCFGDPGGHPLSPAVTAEGQEAPAGPRSHLQPLADS